MSVHDFPKTKPPPEHKDFPFDDEQMQYVDRWLSLNSQTLIRQILGFLTQFVVQFATPIQTAESTTSSTFGNLTTTGPTLTGLPAGKYAILFGFAATSGANDITKRAIAGPKVNSTNPTSPDDCVLLTTVATTIPFYGMKAVLKTLSGDNNTITVVYKSEDNVSTATFGDRWLVAFRQSGA